MKIPYLKKQEGKKYLMVNEKPFLIIGGEVHNSNASTLGAMKPIWKKAKKLGMNCLLLPVSWEMIEPEENVFDFSIVKGLIEEARKNDLKLIFLWFGTWKNAQCYYAPSWVKKDIQRFWRAQPIYGKSQIQLDKFYGMPYSTLSYLCENTKLADAKAFGKLLEYIRKIDENDQTVIMIQVENETGLQGAAREHSELANQKFFENVPKDFINYMKSNTEYMKEDVKTNVLCGKQSGNWEQVFGTVAEEIFSAYYIATYVNKVAEEGKKIYPIPMTVNCWLDKNDEPGVYPCGGPVGRMMEVWKYAAPNIDIISPDIYVSEFVNVCEEYTKLGNPLFIPETTMNCHAASRLIWSIGRFHALGYSPFGFEDIGEVLSLTAQPLLGMDVNETIQKDPQNMEEYYSISSTLQSMQDILLAQYGTDNLKAVIAERPEENLLQFGDYGFKILWKKDAKNKERGVCLAVKTEKNSFFLLLNECQCWPVSLNKEKTFVDVLNCEEGIFQNNIWRTTRKLNGDELATLGKDKITLLKIQLFLYS